MHHHPRGSLLKSRCQEAEKYLTRVKVTENNIGGGSVNSSER